MEDIQSVRKSINDNLDEMERKLKDSLESDVEELVSDLDEMLHDLDIKKSYISTLQEELEAALSIATDLQVFLGLRQLELQVEEEFSYLETFKTSKAMDEVYIVLDISSSLRALSEGSESFGVISKSRKRNALELDIRKKGQAQLLLPSVNTLSNIKFSEKAQFQLPIGEKGIEITDCTVLPEELLIFADVINNRLIICGSDGTFKKDILTPFPPRCLTFINNSTVGLTYPVTEKVVIMELITGQELYSFPTGDKCYGLSYLNEMLTIRIRGSFLRMTLEGEMIGKFKADCTTHCCAGEGCIISSHNSNNSVLCYGNYGDLAW